MVENIGGVKTIREKTVHYLLQDENSKIISSISKRYRLYPNLTDFAIK